MLYQVSKELDAALKARGVPFPVVFGPEPFEPTSAAHERIVFEHLVDDKRDQVTAPKSVHRNPDVTLNRLQGARLRVFARSPLMGAKWNDHSERAEEVLDHVLAELEAIVKARKNTMTWGAGGFVTLKDEKGALVWSGAVYELDLAIDRVVKRTTWIGAGRPEVTVGDDNTEPNVVSIRNVVKASADLGEAGTPPNDAEATSGG